MEEIRDDEPGLVKLTGRFTQTEDPDEASRIADMLLLFLAAGGTILGCIFAAIVTVALFPGNPSGNVVNVPLLICVGLGGAIGFVIVASLLHMKGMVRWERERPKRPS